MRKGRKTFVIHTILQLAKREVHAWYTERPRWIGTLCAGVILGLMGPFGTEDVMRLLPRVIYWTTHAVVSFLLGSLGVALGLHLVKAMAWPRAAGIIIGALFATSLVFIEVVLVDLLVFGPHWDQKGLIILAMNILAICTVLAIAGSLLGAESSVARSAPPDSPALLSRLPFDKRGALISISVSDHYVDVTTTSGTEMLLLRLSDAIRETAPVAGLQIHRSHWVAQDHIKKLSRTDGKAQVTLSDGRALPVSRTYLPSLKDLGF